MKENMTDKELVKECKQGDKAAYAELVSRYTEKAYNLALRITRNQEDAEEILQDVFLTVYNKIDKFQEKAAFSSWLYRITANTSFMKLRKRKQHAAVSMDDVGPAAEHDWKAGGVDIHDTNLISTRHELREALEDAISKLPDEYKTIFILRDVDGLSNQEVGNVLNLSVPAVKSRLHRSRLMLRKKLSKYYNDYKNPNEISYGPSATVYSLNLQNAA